MTDCPWCRDELPLWDARWARRHTDETSHYGERDEGKEGGDSKGVIEPMDQGGPCLSTSRVHDLTMAGHGSEHSHQDCDAKRRSQLLHDIYQPGGRARVSGSDSGERGGRQADKGDPRPDAQKDEADEHLDKWRSSMQRGSRARG